MICLLVTQRQLRAIRLRPICGQLTGEVAQAAIRIHENRKEYAPLQAPLRFAEKMAPSDVVLVHGLYHRAAHMRSLADVLRARGFSTHVPELHRGSLADDTAAVQLVVDSCTTLPIVVGHSYGGAVISGLERIARLVFIAAFVPDVTESCASLGGPDAAVTTWVRPHPSGGTFVPEADAHALFYGDCLAADANQAARNLLPQAGGHGRGKPERAAWKRYESLYIVCTEDRAVDPDLQTVMAKRCTHSARLRAGHSPYISMPAAVADLIDRGGAPDDDRPSTG